MSSASDDDDGSLDVKRSARRTDPVAAAQRFADISDDESDDGRLPPVRTPSPPRRDDEDDEDEDDEDEIKPQRREVSDDERVRVGRRGEEDDERTKVVIDAHERDVVDVSPEEGAVDLLHFPPNLEVNMTVLSGDGELAEGQAYPVSFRSARRGTDGRAIVRAALQQRGPLGLLDVLETNARLVEWSDGSQTICVGDEHYDVISDTMMSNFYLFRKGADVQTVAAAVGSVGRLQTSNVDRMKAKIAQRTVTPIVGKKEHRKVMLTMKEGGEAEEKLAKEEADRKDRERARLESKRRASMANQPRARESARSPRYDSSEEASDDAADRFAEEQEREIKRRRTMSDWSFKKKKAGGRKIVGDSDEEESDD